MATLTRKKRTLFFWAFNLHLLLFAQPTEFTNYAPAEKELIIIELSYLLDSVTLQPIPRAENEPVFEFIENQLTTLSPEINKEVDGPVTMNFQLENHYRYGYRISFSDITVNQPQGLRTTVGSWPRLLNLLDIGQLDSTKMITLTIGPSPAYYEQLDEEPSAYDYALDAAFIDSSIKVDPNRTFTRERDAISPAFPTGTKGLNKFLYEEIIAPIKLEKKTSRTLIYFLTIESDGSISDILATWNRGTYESDFGLKVIERKMPRWIPAYSNGEPVRSLYALAVKIKPFYSQEMITEITNTEQ